MIDQSKTAEERAREAAHNFVRAVNEMGFDAESFADELSRDHRTLQQNSFRVIGAVLHRMAQQCDNKDFDLRNEHSVRAAKRIVGEFGDDLRFVPHV